jgi:hypothetical protein
VVKLPTSRIVRLEASESATKSVMVGVMAMVLKELVANPRSPTIATKSGA